MLKVKFTSRGTTLIASILGELDHHSTEYLKEKMESEILKSTTKNIIFDFSRVSFMDSSGLGVIIGRYKDVQKLNGKVAISNVNPQIKRVFEISGMFKLIPVYEDINDAVEALQ